MSDRIEEARRRAEQRVAEARREAERRLAEVRTAIETEVGLRPQKRYLLLLLVAGAGGFALARRGLRRPGRKKLEGPRRKKLRK